MRVDRSGWSRREWLRSMGVGLGLVAAPRLAGQTEGAAVEPDLVARYPDLKYTNLGGNENPFGPSATARLAIVRSVGESCRYPFREERVLREMLAEREGVAPECITLGNGCDEILSLAAAVFGRPGARIVATRPTYLQLMEQAEHRGAQVDWVDHKRETMEHDLGAMAAAVRAETSLVYVCNPDTPSGTMLSRAEVEGFCRDMAPRVPVFLDEVYLDLLEDFAEQTQVGLVREGLPVIIGRSFSKLHGLAGHRVGYAISQPDVAAAMEGHKMSSMNFLGVAAARASLNDFRFHRTVRGQIARGRAAFCALLDELGLLYTPSVGNFVFFRTGRPIREFEAEMKGRGFIVGRPFPPYDTWCRISIGTEAEMERFAEAMRASFAKGVAAEAARS